MKNLPDLVLHHAPAGIAVVEGEALRFRFVNPAYRRMAGLPEDVIDQRFDEVFPQLTSGIAAQLREVLRTGRALAVDELQTSGVPPGSSRVSYWSGNYIPLACNGDTIDAVAIMLQEVTEQVLARQELEQRARAEAAARRALAASEMRFRGTFNNAAVGIAHVALDGSWLAANQRLADILGYPVEELTALTWQQITHPEDLPRDQELSQRLFAGEIASYELEKRYLRGDGSVVWTYLTAALQHDEHGAPIYAIAVLEDISERKRAEQALAEAEQRLRLAVDAAPLVLFNRDRALRLTWSYNPNNRDLSQPPALADNQNRYHPDDAHRLQSIYRRVMASGQPAREQLEMRWLHPARAYWFDLHVRALRGPDGQINGVTCAAYDISELKRTQQALAERETLLRLALDAAEMGDWACDLDTGVVRHSDSILRVYGLHGSSEHSDADRFKRAVHPEDRAAAQRRISEAIAGGAHHIHQEFRVLQPNGRAVWVASRARIERDAQGRARRLIGVDMDITEEHRLREQLEHSNTALEQFARTVAHDLKAPLQTISSYTDLLKRFNHERLDQRGRLALERVQGAALQMNDLIDGILNFAQATHGARQAAPVELQAALGQALEQLAASIEQTGARITYDPLPTVHGNRLLLVQVLQNLLANALKFKSEQPLRIHLSARRHDREWVISVRDNGIGISRAAQQQLFEAFTRGHSAGGYAGFGLGLSLVKQIVEHHGGSVWVDSAPGRGSTFSFSLPAAAEATPRASDATERPFGG